MNSKFLEFIETNKVACVPQIVSIKDHYLTLYGHQILGNKDHYLSSLYTIFFC